MHPTPSSFSSWLADHDPLTVTRLSDRVVDALGYPAQSAYVETFWLPVLGPSAVWILRRLSSSLAVAHEASVPLAQLSQEVGLGDGTGRHSTVVRTLGRLSIFGMAEISGDSLAVRSTVPPLPRRHLRRLPMHLVELYELELVASATQRQPRREPDSVNVVPLTVDRPERIAR